MIQKFLSKTLFLLVLSTIVFSCKTTLTHHPGKPLPPGQAKKVYGHQSARAFAPGQQKKKKANAVVIINANAPGKGKKKK